MYVNTDAHREEVARFYDSLRGGGEKAQLQWHRYRESG